MNTPEATVGNVWLTVRLKIPDTVAPEPVTVETNSPALALVGVLRESLLIAIKVRVRVLAPLPKVATLVPLEEKTPAVEYVIDVAKAEDADAARAAPRSARFLRAFIDGLCKFTAW
jgi:hypothetical protein